MTVSLLLPRLRGAALAAALGLLLSACQPGRAPVSPLGQASFAAYVIETRDWLRAHRTFQSADHDVELGWNAPMEWRPSTRALKGIVLVHGLGDSPWSFADLGQSLAAQGFLVRALLLPGHGTKPADLVQADFGDWRALVRQQVAMMKKDVSEVYLGGFSTGANLALDYAIDDASVRGLLLFSPALKSPHRFEWLVPVLARARPWMRAPDGPDPQQSPVRYLNIPSNGFAQYYRSAVTAREKIARTRFDRPTLVVSAEHDSVVDAAHMLRTFQDRFTHTASRMIWYGALPRGSGAGSRVLVRPDRLPLQRISEFSHMGVLFSPANPLYGSAGKQRLCWNGQEAEAMRRCEAGAEVWYSDWGYRVQGKIHARLTFNPYYDWQAEVMRSVVAAAGNGR